MMLTTQLVENREILRNEANLNGYADGKYPSHSSTGTKSYHYQQNKENKANTSFSIRTITLKSPNFGEIRKEGTSKRLPDAEFQLRREKGLCFKCNEKYSADHNCKMKEQRELRMFVVNNNNEELEIVEEVESEAAELRTAKDVLPLELRGVDVILGMQWLYLLGVTVCDWKNLTLTFYDNEKQICIKGDPSLTKARVSLNNLVKSWKEQDHGYLIECRSIEVAELNELMIHQKEEREEFEEKLIPILNQFSDIFEWLEKLPPRRSIEHHIHLKEGTNPVNVRPYQYAYHQKEEMERLVNEMLASGIIRPSASPYSSLVLLVKKKMVAGDFGLIIEL
ncbi:hypothetical protein IC582_011500 [Cucumis melo]